MTSRTLSHLLLASLAALSVASCQTDQGARGRAGDTGSVQGRQGTEAGGGFYGPRDTQQTPRGTRSNSNTGGSSSTDTGSGNDSSTTNDSGAQGRPGQPDDTLPGARGSSATNPDSSDRIREQGRDWDGRY